MMAAILNSALLNLSILNSAILVFPLKLTHTCQDWFPPFAQKKPSLIHSDSTWWWQPSCILPCWFQTLPSWIQTSCYLLSDSLKNTLTPFWLWLKLIQSDSNSFILTQLDDGSHLEFGHLGFSHFVQNSWLNLIQSDSNSFILTQLDDGSHLEFYQFGFSHFAQKKLHSFMLTQHDDGSHLEFCHVGLRHRIETLPSWIQTPCYLLSDSLQNTLTPLWLWLKVIQSDSNSFILTQLDDGSHLEFYHLGFSHLSFLVFPLKLTHACQDWFPPFAQKTFTHSFWLNLMMAAILNSGMLDSDTAILDLDTLLSSVRFTQKHCHSTLTQTNSIWFQLIHSDSTWWWQPSWIWPSRILPSHSHLPRLVPTICTKKTFTHSFWLNLMMAAILNATMLDSDTAILDSDTLLSSVRFTQKHSHSTLTLTQTNSIWF